jgi:hypothetical protein
MKVKYLFLAISLLFMFNSCNKDDNKNLVPVELRGAWEGSCCGGCDYTYTFSAAGMNFYQYCSLTRGEDDYDILFEEYNSSKQALYSNSGYWYAFHVTGNFLNLKKCNDDAELSALSDDWWETDSGVELIRVSK